MTAPTISPVKFPGYSLATPRPGGGWEKLRTTDPRLLPAVPLDTLRQCPSNGYSDPHVYDRQWCCTAHAEGWHIVTAMGGHVVAVFPDATVDAAARVARVQADEGEA